MRLIGCLLVGLFVLTLAGCSAVYTVQPMGEKPCKTQTQDWEGTWIHKEGSVTVRVMDGENGWLRIGWIEREGEDLASEVQDVQLWEAGSWTFANVKSDSAGEPAYLWAGIRRDGNQVIVWLPDEKKFKVLVEEGKLPGRIEPGGDVILDRLEPQHLSMITEEREGVLLVWGEPTAFLRLTRAGD